MAELSSIKTDRLLTASDITSLHGGREDLDPFADWLRKDQEVQSRVANAWNRLVLEDKDGSLLRTLSVPSISNRIPGISDEDNTWIGRPRYDYDRDPHWLLPGLRLF